MLRIRDQLVELLRRGGFALRKWASNSTELLSDINSSDHGLACTRPLAPDENLTVLGIGWNPHSDTFRVSVSVPAEILNTKCNILSIIARLYDPLGWVTPVTIAAIILMQQLWRLKIGWDDPVPDSLADRWLSIFNRLSHLDQLHISRWNSLGADVVSAELHGFADALNVAYAAAVYLRVVSRSGDVSISLLAAKSRVAPLTPITIPRLELSATVILARLLAFVRDSLNLPSLSCTCWTDSTIVLAWLKQHPSRWKMFVAN